MTAQRQLSESERIDWLRLFRSENIGPATFQTLLQRFGTAAKAIEALPELSRRGGRSKPIAVASRMRAETEIAEARKHNARFVASGERGYPPLLQHAAGAPPLLCIAGNLDLAALPSVAIVGARSASAHGLRFTRMIARALAEHGVLVASGLARGIDTAAHEAALAHATAAVLAGGIDHVYPPENEGLQRKIAEAGLLITEMPPGTAPKPEYFPRRNRIISGMSRVIIVVEAALRSGSLITARFAAEQGRDVFAVPGSPLDPRAEGTNRLIKEGAAILTSVQDVIEALGMTGGLQAQVFPPVPPEPVSGDGHQDISDPERGRLMELLSPAGTHVDDLIRESGLPAEAVTAILLELEVAGRIVRSAGGQVASAAT